MIVAIDGPAGSGKSTTARLVAKELGYTHIDTGAMYRAVTLAALEQVIPLDDDDALAALARRIRITLEPAPDRPRALLDGRDVTVELRTPEVDRHVSRVSAVGGVRDAVVAEQRALGRTRDAVMEGRDIGTVVFPDAEVKIYLVASDAERARRRQKELASRGIEVPLDEVLAEIRRRDAYDSGRAIAPLRPAADAVHVDTTTLTVAEQVARIVDIVRARVTAGTR